VEHSKSTTDDPTKSLFFSSGAIDPGDKRARILRAALQLFLRYGIRRTSIDDVAREAGIAKGTFYLYFDSKDTLFTAAAEHISAEKLAKARLAAASGGTVISKLVGILDIQVGVMCRLIAESPHIAELTEARASLAAIYDAFDRDMDDLLTEVLVQHDIRYPNAARMLVACGMGVVELCGTDEAAFKDRLSELLEVLIAGFRATSKP